MRVAVHQPQYLPWLGYLAKWAAADVFVFLDTVQYEKNGWQNRNRIRTADGAHWLTVPVHARLGTPIREVSVDTTQPWRARHLRAIEHAYARAPHLPAYRDGLRALLDTEWARLAPLTVASAEWLALAAGIATPARPGVSWPSARPWAPRPIWPGATAPGTSTLDASARPGSPSCTSGTSTPYMRSNMANSCRFCRALTYY